MPLATFAAPNSIEAFVEHVRAGRKVEAYRAYRDGTSVVIEGRRIVPSLRTCLLAYRAVDTELGDCLFAVDQHDVNNFACKPDSAT